MVRENSTFPTQPQYTEFLKSEWHKIPYLQSVNPATALRGLGRADVSPLGIASGELLLQAIAADELHHMIIVCRLDQMLKAILVPDPMCVPLIDPEKENIGHVMSIFDQIQDPEEFPGLLGAINTKIREWTTQSFALYSPVGFNLGIAFDYAHRPGLAVGPLMPGAFKRLIDGRVVSNFH